MKLSNIFGFGSLPVAGWTILTYLVFLIPSIIVHERLPPAPENLDQPLRGVNVTEAWFDLLTLTSKFHPLPSRRNEELRTWLFDRIQTILDRNEVEWTNSSVGGVLPSSQTSAVTSPSPLLRDSSAPVKLRKRSTGPAVTVFDDTISNVTMAMYRLQNASSSCSRQQALGAYFEGTNLAIYIRGSEDDEGEWWETGKSPSGSGVLVNAHMDSVSTAYGTSDDGIAVVSILQMVSYFTQPGQQPKHGIVALINNGEEDGLWGSRAFGYSPLLPFTRTFVNLEGAGANSRALLFRATDKEVVDAYRGVSTPFGTVVASDGFRLGLIQSDTDYTVFTKAYGQRGVDIAFYRPRARYHTNQDDISHSSIASMWHMMNSAIETVSAMSNAAEDTYKGAGTDGVWFDTFGYSFVVMTLKSLFSWAVAMLVISPLALGGLTFFLIRADKYYFFSGRFSRRRNNILPVVNGWNGLFRYPIALIVSILAVIVSGLIIAKGNPFIIYSSEYSIWSMSLSIFIFTFWAISRRASLSKSTALQRGFAVLWLYALSWVILVAVTYLLSKPKISAGYFFVIFHTLMFGAALITLGELYFLPPRSVGAQMLLRDEEAVQQSASLDPALSLDPTGFPAVSEDRASGDDTQNPRNKAIRNQISEEPSISREPILQRLKLLPKREVSRWRGKHGENEAWFEDTPSCSWLLQFLMIAPATIIFICNIGLLLGSSVSQTGSDGSSVLTPILFVALFSIMLAVPTTPFVHRLSWPLPTFFLLIFLATFIYNLAAFPFNSNSRYKAFFQNAIDLDTGASVVRIGGIEKYVRQMIPSLPSSMGKPIQCGITAPPRNGIVLCEYDGSEVLPNITKALTSGEKLRPMGSIQDWLAFNVSRGNGDNKAKMTIDAANSKACQIRFDRPVSNFSVRGGAGLDYRFGDIPATGIDQIKLWRRDWDTAWEVEFEWRDADMCSSSLSPAGSIETGQQASDGISRMELRLRDFSNLHEDGPFTVHSSNITGRVVCIWADANEPGTIPALDEIFRFAPQWSTVTKLLEGLVEGSKRFSV
ncbi:putative zinc metalloprotease [Thozetella sp. PMI_491]|nr:putative zinc metalloprotease [Thozetella sp. PMI_491]